MSQQQNSSQTPGEAADCVTQRLGNTAKCSQIPVMEELCHVSCCCAKYPVRSSKGRRLMQVCADRLLESYIGQGNRSYRNSVAFCMTHHTKIQKGNKKCDKSSLDGKKCVRRIPDVCIVDEKGDPVQIVDFKFDKDHWQKGQKEAYQKILSWYKKDGQTEKDVIALRNKKKDDGSQSCGCEDGK